MKSGAFIILMLISICMFPTCSKKNITGFNDIDNELIEIAAFKSWHVLRKSFVSNRFPQYYDYDGKIYYSSASDWTSGFFPGTLWHLYRLTGDSFWKIEAEKWTEMLESQKLNANTHDIGFVIMSSFGNGLSNTFSAKYKSVIIEAAETLIGRFNSEVGAIKSWDNTHWDYPVIIDNLINLELLFIASSLSGDKKYKDIAISHLAVTINNHIRNDGSVIHVVDFDPVTGRKKGEAAGQGKGVGSTWSRGQAWAVLGFVIAYRETGDPVFLEQFKKVFSYYLEHLPTDLVPYWDFSISTGNRKDKDASASVIVAYSLLELANFIDIDEESLNYQTKAVNILKSLEERSFLSFDKNRPGIVRHTIGHKPRELQIDVTLVYADYYYLKALVALSNSDIDLTFGNH